MHSTVPKRVTHIVHDLQGGGLESLVAAMATHFSGGSTTMSIITLGGRVGRVGRTIRPQVEQFHVLDPVRGLSMVVPLSLLRCIRKTRPDIVHLHSGVWFKGAWAARLARVNRVVYTEHGLLDDFHWIVPWLLRRAASMTDTIVTVSDLLPAQLEAAFGIPRTRCMTISNGVDLSRFAPGRPIDDLRMRLGIPASALVVGSVGRLEPVKAYDDLIRAFTRLVSATTDVERALHLVLCGDGSERERLRQLAADLGIAGRVSFAGWVAEPLEAYRAMDVFALTSLREGVPLSLLEAMACRVLPVVTDVGSNSSILGPDLAGQVVPPGDPDALVRVLGATLREAALGSERGQQVRARIEAHYGLAAMLENYRRIYTERPDALSRPSGST